MEEKLEFMFRCQNIIPEKSTTTSVVYATQYIWYIEVLIFEKQS